MRALEAQEKLIAARKMYWETCQQLKEKPTSKILKMRKNQLYGNIQYYTRFLSKYGTTGEIYICSWEVITAKGTERSFLVFTGLASQQEAVAIFRIRYPNIKDFKVKTLKSGVAYTK